MLIDVPQSAARIGRGGELGFVRPQLPTLTDAPPSEAGWVHEIKHDGYRTIVVVENGSGRAFTRNGYDWTDRYVPVANCAARLPRGSAILDGEIIVQGENGISDFYALRHAMARQQYRLVFYVFDLLHLDGKDLRSAPLLDRKGMLRQLVGPDDPFCPIQVCEHDDGDGVALFSAASKMGLEGIVSKKADSRYKGGRSSAWRKTKCWSSGEFVVIGTEHVPGQPPTALLARATEHDLVYAGSAFVTLAEPERDLFWKRAEQLGAEQPAIGHLRNSKARWCRPDMHVSVRHLRGGGMLRHAIVARVL